MALLVEVSMRGFGGVAMALVLAVGCGRGSSGQGGAADTTAASPAPVDGGSVVPIAPRDSSSPVSATAPTKAPPKVPGNATPAPPAYDSAFGPSFTVDSTGKVTPIGKKKP